MIDDIRKRLEEDEQFQRKTTYADLMTRRRECAERFEVSIEDRQWMLELIGHQKKMINLQKELLAKLDKAHPLALKIAYNDGRLYELKQEMRLEEE